ncbi:MAG: helix-turn-helix domain-containing protein [Bdellovibrionales bacterium]
MSTLKQILQEKGVSQIELAKQIGVADSAVSKWIKWGFKIPFKHKAKICAALNCELSDLNDRGDNA